MSDPTNSMATMSPRDGLRVPDGQLTWRLIYRLDADAVVIVEVFAKKTPQTPRHVIATCRSGA